MSTHIMKKNRRKKPADTTPKFIFTKEGKVQLWEQDRKKGMLATSTRADAEKFVAWMRDHRGETLTIAEIGTVEGETAEAQFKAAVAHGADCVFVIWFDGDTIRLQPVISTDWSIPRGGSRQTDRKHPIPIAALFDEGAGPNLSSDPRKLLADAAVIMGVDVMSQREFLVYGRKTLEQIVRSGATQRVPVVDVALDQETDELEKLLALVTVLKGHDDYQAG